MRRLAATVAACMIASAAFAQHPAADSTKASKQKVSHAMRPFVGTWKLASSQETLPNGTVRPYGFGPHPAGMLMYDAKGNMCAQVVNTDRPKWKDPDKPSGAEIKTALDGFGGYCGTYTVDEKNSTMAHYPEISFDPNLVGQPKARSYRFEGNRLIYTGTEQTGDGVTNWVMVWEKVN